MSRKAELINEIKALFFPQHTFAAYFIQDASGKFQHKGKLLTKEECRKIPARKHYFIVPANRQW